MGQEENKVERNRVMEQSDGVIDWKGKGEKEGKEKQ